MPRKARIDAPGALHHLIIRGIERRQIFRSDFDRENFLNRLSVLIPETKTDCFAWALIPNHVHLVMRTGVIPISIFMNRLLTGYAGWFNKKYQRHGHLFQNRYKSILCQEDRYLKELVRYIHLNPLRAGIVKGLDELEKHPWCGHGTLMGVVKRAWQNTDYVYGWFDERKEIAQKKYRKFVDRGVEQGKRPDLTGGGLIRSTGGWTVLQKHRKEGIRSRGDERILGDSDFVINVLKSAEESFEQKYDLRIRGYDFDRVIERVAEVMGINTDLVTASGKSPRIVEARSLLCFWAQRRLGISTVAIAQKLEISQSAVSRASKRGEIIAKERGVALIDWGGMIYNPMKKALKHKCLFHIYVLAGARGFEPQTIATRIRSLPVA